MYLNGQVQASTNSTTDCFSSIAATTETYIGQNFKGTLDQVKIFNYARTPAQIAYDYNQGQPVGWWKMDECQGGIANDASGNNNAGTITIGATGSQTAVGTCTTTGTAWGNGATGKYNSSLNFDGTDDFTSINASSSLALDGTNESIFLWVKYTGNSVIAMFSDDWRRRLFSTSWTIIDINSVYRYLGIGTLNDGQWHLTGYTYSNGYLKSYLDGKLIDSQASANLNPRSGAIWLGRLCSGASCEQYYSGQIDDVKVFNYALSAEQV